MTHESKKYQECRKQIAVAVEYALIIIGPQELETVKERLKGDYDITIENSLDNPEYLKSIMCDLFGNAYEEILDTIYRLVDDAKDEEIVKDFLYVMKN